MSSVVVDRTLKASPAKREIPYVNIAEQHKPIKNEIISAIEAVVERGDFILGKEVSEFESEFASLCGAKYAVSLASGTDALLLALRLLKVGPDDEVITVANSFISTVSSICLLGAKPVLVDVREDGNINPKAVEAAITNKTRAILPVHLTGKPADMDAILPISKRHQVPIIEDAAQAVTAQYQRKYVGSFGAFGCFSLHPLKTLNALGDGGILTTSDDDAFKDAMTLRNLGLESRNNCVRWSGHSRLDTIHAASLLVKLRYLGEWTEKRRRNAAHYREVLKGISEVKCPQDSASEYSVYHTFVIKAQKRDQLQNFLSSRGIGSAVHYPVPVHLQTIGKSLRLKRGALPVTERLADEILSLPIYPELTEDDIGYVAAQIKAFYKETV